MGTPHDIYHRPQSRFVADFIGSPTIILHLTSREDRVMLLDRES